jgi:hypothetical protein
VTILRKARGVKAGEAKYGKGLFATKVFKAESEIGEITGERFQDPDYSSEYCIDLGDDMALEPGKPFRYLNHSCEPNCKLFVVFDEDSAPIEERRVIVESLIDIPKGAELTIDYEWPADSSIPCGCGAANCRGWIVAPGERHLLPQKPR